MANFNDEVEAFYEIANQTYRVYGNKLDKYDNPTYTLSLYMQPEDNSPVDQRVILAQSGVTSGNIIDNLEIQAVTNYEGGFISNMVTFTITQPGMANFVDQLLAASDRVGRKPSTMFIMYLDITFKGYDADPESASADGTGLFETGGEIERNIAGVFRFKISMMNFDVSIDEGGSSYDMKCVTQNGLGFNDYPYRLPQTFVTKGTTIENHVNNLVTQYNEKLEATNEGVLYYPDVIEIDLSQLIGGSGGGDDLRIQDQTIILTEEGNPDDADSNTEDRDSYSSREGDSMYEWFKELLKMNNEFVQRVSRVKDIGDSENTEVDYDQTFVNWFLLDCDVVEGPYDPKRKDYQRTYKYTPRIIKTPRTDVAVSPDEPDLPSDKALKRLNEIMASGVVRKGYFYYYTGLNDQIIDLDIRYSAGVTLLYPAGGGSITGDPSPHTIAQNTTVFGQNQPLTQEALRDRVSAARNAEAVLTSLAGSLEGASGDGAISSLSDFFGLSPDLLRSLAEQASDNAAATGAQLNQVLDSRTINQAASASQMNASPGSNAPIDDGTDNTTGPTTEYNPSVSAAIFSSDIVESGINGSTGTSPNSTTSPLRQISRTVPQEGPTTDSAANRTNELTNTRYSFVSRQFENQAFLIKLEMTLRGDPWYLGNPGIVYGAPNRPIPEPDDNVVGVEYQRGDNLILFQLRSPANYDPDVEDEDSELNTGYKAPADPSDSFSGLYRIMKVTNSFSGGDFKSSVMAVKEFGFDLSRMRNQAASTNPDNGD